MPLSATEISELDDLRQKRNLVGHYFGREKQKYEAPYFSNRVQFSVSHMISSLNILMLFTKL